MLASRNVKSGVEGVIGEGKILLSAEDGTGIEAAGESTILLPSKDDGPTTGEEEGAGKILLSAEDCPGIEAAGEGKILLPSKDDGPMTGEEEGEGKILLSVKDWLLAGGLSIVLEDLTNEGSTLKNGVEGVAAGATAERGGAKGRVKFKIPFGAPKGVNTAEEFEGIAGVDTVEGVARVEGVAGVEGIFVKS